MPWVLPGATVLVQWYRKESRVTDLSEAAVRLHPDLQETIDAAGSEPSEVALVLTMEPAVRRWIDQALSTTTEPHLG